MNTPFIIRKIILIVLLLAIVIPAGAQEDSQNPHPLLDMLAFVPDAEQAQSEIYYADLLASAGAVSGEIPESGQQAWVSMGYPDNLWFGWLPYALPEFRDYLLLMIDDGGQSTGLDVSTIERTLQFGQPPSLGLILQGEFDHEAIVTTLTAETHELQPRDDITLLCSIDGCEDGLTQNIRERDVVNPFGGNLGRREPIALLDDFIINSADFEVLESMLEAGGADTPSLADSADYQAAVSAATQQGVLRQAVFVHPESAAVGTFDAIVSPLLTEEQKNALQSQVTPLPPYQLIMFADTSDLEAGIQAGLVLLVYDTEEAANTALDALRANLAPDGIVSSFQNRPISTIMAERGDLQYGVTADEATGRYVAGLSLQAPQVKLPQPDETSPTFAGMQFRLFLNMVFARDTLWLVYDLEAE
jgi:hypothetical protein